MTIPLGEALAARLHGDLASRAVSVPQLGYDVTLRVGWQQGSYRLCSGWRALAIAMGLQRGEELRFTIAYGTVRRIERASAAPAAVSSAVGTSAGDAARSAEDGSRAEAAEALPVHEPEVCAFDKGVRLLTRAQHFISTGNTW